MNTIKNNHQYERRRKMNVIRSMVVGILLLLLYGGQVYSQFHVIPHVDLEVNLEQGYLYPPSTLRLIGCGNDSNDVYVVKIDLNMKKYSIYDVKPGQYLIYISDGNPSPFFQYQTMTVYDSVKQVYSTKRTNLLNKIEVRDNRNLKLKIAFKMCVDYSGYQPVISAKFKDFDYIEIDYYSTFPTVDSQSSLLRESIRKGSSMRQSSSPACGAQDGTWSKTLGYTCTLDSGNIEIKINNAYFENKWMNEVPDQERIGDTTMGDQGDDKYVCGVCSTSGWLIDNLSGNNPHPGEWQDNKATGSCDDGNRKCKLSFEFNIAVKMTTAVWNHEEMCSEINTYNKIPVYDPNNPQRYQCNCECNMQAIIAHEATHCTSWMSATEKSNDVLQTFCSNNQTTYTANRCCKNQGGDGKCQEQADDLKYEIFGNLNTALVDNIFSILDSSPEGPSLDAEPGAFDACRAKNECDADE